MLVSAISANNNITVFNTNINSRGGERFADTSDEIVTTLSTKNVSEKQAKLYDSINEWKLFCHSQIEKGKLDIIV